jgi:hypothetical protein
VSRFYFYTQKEKMEKKIRFIRSGDYLKREWIDNKIWAKVKENKNK